MVRVRLALLMPGSFVVLPLFLLGRHLDRGRTSPMRCRRATNEQLMLACH